MYFYVHINAYIKYVYKQLINRRSNLTCGLTSLLVLSHYLRGWGTRVSWDCSGICELTSIPTWSVPNLLLVLHPQRFQGVRSLMEGSSRRGSPGLLVLVPGHPAGQCLQLFHNISVHIEKFWSIPVLAEVNVYQNGHYAALLYCALGPHSAKPLNTFFSWSNMLLCFLETLRMNIFSLSKFPFQSSTGETKTILCNLSIEIFNINILQAAWKSFIQYSDYQQILTIRNKGSLISMGRRGLQLCIQWNYSRVWS